MVPAGHVALRISFTQKLLQTKSALRVQSTIRLLHRDAHTDPPGAVHVHSNGAAHMLLPAVPQVSGGGQLPQEPPQPSSPHSLRVQSGVQPIVVVVELVVVVVVVVSQTWAAVHISSSEQVPQFSGARVRQVPSAIMPQWAPAASHVVGVQQAPAGLLPGGELLTHSPLWPFVPQQL